MNELTKRFPVRRHRQYAEPKLAGDSSGIRKHTALMIIQLILSGAFLIFVGLGVKAMQGWEDRSITRQIALANEQALARRRV